MKKYANPKAVIHASVEIKLAQDMAKIARSQRTTLSNVVEQALRLYRRAVLSAANETGKEDARRA